VSGLPPGAPPDVIVVGAGPAGSTMAALLRGLGHDVLVLDSARFPRDKVCGEAVSPQAWPVLEATGAADRVRDLRPWPLRGMALTSVDGTVFAGRYPEAQAAGFAARRVVLDAVLLDQARARGACVREGVRVSGLLRERGRVAGVEATGPEGQPITFGARVVVGADGRHSVVARALGLRRRHRMRRFAVRGHWEGVSGLLDTGEMHVARGGYCGIAPLSGSLANVAFVLDRTEMQRAGGDVEGFYREQILSRWPGLAERLSGARLLEPPRVIGPLAVTARAVSAPGAVLVGDAAGFYDPFTGEGVTLALRTAQIAAAAVDRALRASSPADADRALDAYARERYRATRDKFRFNRLLQVAVGWPDAGNAIARRLARRPDLADRLVGVAGDFVPARDAVGPRFLWDLLRP
jgi:geranylgeranyl reductase family protein